MPKVKPQIRLVLPEEDWEGEVTVVSRVKRDIKNLSAFAAKLGFVLAILCHFVPPHYRIICDTLKSVCTP